MLESYTSHIMITVVNAKTHNPTAFDFRIDRGTVLGNPYTMKGHRQTLAKYFVDSRKELLSKYSVWLLDKLIDPQSAQSKEFRRILKHAMKNDIFLVCHCKPLDCEGDLIKKLLENLIFQSP